MKNRLWLMLHFIRYQWRERLLTTVMIAILIGVGALSGVNFFGSSVKQMMDERSSALLGADWLVESSQVLPIDDWSVRAADLGLESAETVEFLSMVAAGDHLQLASIKAVDEGYPLRGQLQIRDTIDGSDHFTDEVPKQNEVWVAARLLPALHLQIGDSIEIGAAKFKITRALVQEPDAGLAFLALAPRVMMNVADLPQTQVIDAGSRVEYRFLVGGNHADVTLLAEEISPELHAQDKIINNMNARPEVVQPIDSLLHFLTLTALIIFLLSALAIALATRTYASRQTDSTAILRCLGAVKRDMLMVYFSSLLTLAVIFSALACALGFGIAYAFMQLAAHWWQVALPMPMIQNTVLVAFASGIILVLGFAWPWLLNLQNVSPLRVLQRQLPPPAASSYWVYGSMTLAFILLWSLYQTPVLTGWMAFSVVIILAAITGLIYGLLQLARYFGKNLAMPWRLGVMQATYEKRNSLMQIGIFTFVLTLVFFFLLMRQDFLFTWKNKLPPEAPNYFVINLLPNQISDVEHFFAQNEQTVPTFYPMVRARITMLNEKTVSLEDYPKGDAPNMLRRDLNLSYSEALNAKTIVQGKNWDLSAYDSALLSVEEKMAQELNLHLGDTITFQAGVTTFTGKIANIRHVDWYSMQPNFYVITTPGLLVDFPTTYLGSFYLPKTHEDFLNQLAAQFPNLTLIDVDAIISNMQAMIVQALVIIEVLFMLVCLASLLVLLVIQRTQTDNRAYISAVLRTLGAGKDQLIRGFLSEFAVIGLLSGMIAITLAQSMAFWMSRDLLALTPQLNGLFILSAPIASMLLYVLLGSLVLRGLMREVVVLRLAGE